MDIIPFTEVKAHLSEIMDRVDREHDRITVTKNGRPVAVVISPDDLEVLEETLEILEDREFMKGLRRSITQAETGNISRLDEHYPRAT